MSLTKRPVQIYLEVRQLEQLRALAARRGVAVAALVREGVDQVLHQAPAEDDPLFDIVGLFDSGLGDLAARHDSYIAELIRRENE